MPYSINSASIKNQQYPSILKEIPSPPEVIYFRGVLPEKNDILIGIVGTRKVSLEGKITAKNIAKDLAQNGVTIVSGLALGIDTAAHEGALAGNGKTIAVLANGLNQVYPRSNENLANEILKNGGALMSEYPEGTPAYPNQFLERNRIISGLCGATVIIEAPIHSGALVTARHALDQGREIFVTPGPTRHPNYEGSHLLLRNGARLVTSANDILEDLNINKKNDSILTKEEKYDKETFSIINPIKSDRENLTLDNIVEITKLEPHVVAQRTTFLILDGAVQEKNGKFSIKSS